MLKAQQKDTAQSHTDTSEQLKQGGSYMQPVFHSISKEVTTEGSVYREIMDR